MKRIAATVVAVLTVLTASLGLATTAGPAYADDTIACATGTLEEQNTCLRDLHDADSLTITGQTETIAGLRFALDGERQRAAFWMSVAGQEEERVTQLQADLNGVYTQKAYWMDKAYKRLATIMRLRAIIHELRGQ